MSFPLSTLGIIHTIIGIVAIIFAFAALLRDGVINPKSTNGKYYVFLTVITSLLSFGVRKTGDFSPAHLLSVLILIILPIAVFASSINFFGKKATLVQVVGMTVTLFLSLIPTFVETLTRLPVNSPIAENQDDPVLKAILSVLTLVFAVGIFYQLKKLK